MRPGVENLYLLNFVYWLIPRPEWGAPYYYFLSEAYSTPAVLDLHLTDVRSLIGDARREGATVVGVLYPFLSGSTKADHYVDAVGAVFDEDEVPFVDVRALVRDLPRGQRIAGANDGHPSPKVHGLVARDLIRVFGEHGLERW